MSRIYTVAFTGVAVTVAQDLFEITALRLLVGAGHLFDAASGQEYFARSGFQLIGVDSAGDEHELS